MRQCAGADEPETREEAKGVLGSSGGEGKGLSKFPTTNTHRTSSFQPSSRLLTRIGNKRLEVASLILLWKHTESKQGQSSKGLLRRVPELGDQRKSLF